MTTPAEQVRDAIREGRERFLALQPRERWMVGGASVVVLLTILYLGVVEPIVKAHQRRADALESARALAIRLEEASVVVQRASARGNAGINRGQSLMAAVDMATRSSAVGKAPARIQPEGDAEVRVWFEDVSFDPVVRLVADLQTRHGITVQTMDVEQKSDVGSVDVRLSLVRR
ncbi:MAG TPA: type II secretion system protein M [Nevskiaceae bacterium]|nr:type II secretion system protein M [Nevskiaceae bacterium]